MAKFSLAVVFSVLLACEQLPTGVNGLYGSPSGDGAGRGYPLEPTWRGLFPSPGLRGRVLRGAYGSSGPIKPNIHKEEQRSTDPVLNSLLRHAPAQIFGPNATLFDVDKTKLNFVDVVIKCASMIKYCLLNSIGSQMCSLSCLLDPFKVSKHTASLVDTAAKSLCSAVGSIFDGGIPTLQSKIGKIHQLPHFLKLLEIKPEKYRQFGKAATNALSMQLIKYGKSPILDKFKPVIATIATALSVGQARFDDQNWMYENSACFRDIDLGNPVRKIAEQFITNPFTVDINLPGFFVLSNIGQFRTNPLTVMVDSVLHAFRLFTGVHCSLIQFAESGMGSNCKDVTGYTGLPKGATGARSEVNDDICGTLPDVPYVDLNKIFPDVFPYKAISTDTVYYDIREDEFMGTGFEVKLNGANNTLKLISDSN